AFADHGVCEGHTIEEGLEEARHTLGDLASVGIDLDFVTRQLVDEGIQKFIDPFDQLMKILADRREKVLAEAGAQQPTAWSTAKTDVAALLGSLRSKRFSRRLAARDPHLWTAEPAVADSIRNRLGWLDGVDSFAQKLGEISQFAAEVKAGGCSHAVLAGMGGSSLCPEVCRQTFGRQPGWPELTVLDSTDAAAVRGAWKTLDPSGALFIIASKSGTTTESACFYKYLYEQVRRRMGADEAGRRFVAITDPGSPLAAEAEERDFLRAFLNPADIGGRYSALSYFGLVPMALMGLDISRMMESARRMALSCGPEVPLENNPAVILGAFLAVHRNRGRDKVTLVLSPSIGSLGIWIEQLLAESTGKHGTGLVPIDGESIGKPEAYAGDRIFIGISVKEDDSRNLARRLRDLERAGHPVVRIELSDPYALGGEFLRWEIATATAGSIMGVNPFDEPNVGESKHNTRMLLEEWKRNGSFEDQGPVLVEDGISLYADRLAPWYPRQEFASTQQFLEAFLQSAKAPDYLAWLAYFAPLARRDKKLQKIRAAARDRMRIATTIGYGPRYLHSTGQLHKGGPGNGVFVILTAESKRDLPIPGEDFGFATLLQAQALGDYRALNSKG
ncbi:MAG: transaldolase, partial [Acidobacteria bacterium]|nr:transaldolase [Acidobacteriota bacterium]